MSPSVEAVASQLNRKVWVRRPFGSPILVESCKGDVVDDVRTRIWNKYPNSLGLMIDSADIELWMSHHPDYEGSDSARILQPDEDIFEAIDLRFPLGQKMDEALVIHYSIEPPKPDLIVDPRYNSASPSVRNLAPASARENRPATSVMGSYEYTPPPPPLPQSFPPRSGAQLTIQNDSTTGTSSNPQRSHHSVEVEPLREENNREAWTERNGKKIDVPVLINPTSPKSKLGDRIPPINVLIVEDNLVTLRVLERFMNLLDVRWQSAVNGKVAIEKWKSGSFQLILMDIQMPVMNGLQSNDRDTKT